MPQVVLDPQVKTEIDRLAQFGRIDSRLLEEFAYFVLETSQQQSSQKAESLKTDKLKQSVYERFSVKSTSELKTSGAFRMATEGMEKLDFRLKLTWETLYRKFVGILPHEKSQEGYGCINGIDIFKYFKPWQVFGLNPKTATKSDVKNAYHQLSKIYHPDNLVTGDREIFEQIETMYKSIIAGF
ncbi:molecular chaperone DnaJ [Geitlerinema sp. P-1104]|uniref:DnaJ domain-containing protein n=1 Tax=Geitlerinema sp. P-1104 TaxID=2546230 RepID=UPI00147717A7|nr:DnaJ domain-containing protein [Geitlerinema sp. P-1104]NMG57265.1 molecular chaperone DnaJ [Geitlerinema sp. P-1104]